MGVGTEWERERGYGMCDSSLVLFLFSWSEIVAKQCSLDFAHTRRSLMLQLLLG